MEFRNNKAGILLVVIFIVLLVGGCSQDYSKVRDIYNAEKLFYKANKTRQNIIKLVGNTRSQRSNR